MNIRRSFLTLLLGAACAGNSYSADFSDGCFLKYDHIPAELTGRVMPGHDIDLELEENATTGYVWSASYDPRVVHVKIDHKGPRRKTDAVGVPGYADIEIKPLTLQSAQIILYYARPFEPGVKPVKSVKCVVTPIAAAPVPVSAVQQPDAPVMPDNVPLVADDTSFRYDSVPSALRVELPVGEDIEFDLEEMPKNGVFWSVRSVPSKVCTVKIKHDNDNGWFSRPEAEIEIKGLCAGFAVVEFVSGAPAALKVVRCFVNVR